MDGQDLICFRDPMKISEIMVFLSTDALPIVSLFDGNHSIGDIQAEYMRAHGRLIYSDQILQVALGLDEHYLLDSTRFQEHHRKLQSDFADAPIRKASVAGNGYDLDPTALRSMLDGFFLLEDGPGTPPRFTAEPAGMKGFVAPHIDFMRGGACYAWAYKDVAERSNADVYVLLGTAHMPMERYFALCNKGFETPFGVLPADEPIMSRLADSLGTRFFKDQFVHRHEHSLEFQAVYLGYLFGQKRTISIVPILCGSFHDIMQRNASPSDVEEIATFLDALRSAISDDGRTVCVVAGADLAHIGPQFGDDYTVTPEVMEALKTCDLAMLDFVVRGDEQGFFNDIMQEDDARKICGLPPIYALLQLLQDDAQGSLLNYSQWRDPEGNGAVTFAGLSFY
jgi:AmmeMemoRadiSam system protein B